MDEYGIFEFLLREGGPLYAVLAVMVAIIVWILRRLDAMSEKVDKIYDKYEDCMKKRVEDARNHVNH